MCTKRITSSKRGSMAMMGLLIAFGVGLSDAFFIYGFADAVRHDATTDLLTGNGAARTVSQGGFLNWNSCAAREQSPQQRQTLNASHELLFDA